MPITGRAGCQAGGQANELSHYRFTGLTTGLLLTNALPRTNTSWPDQWYFIPSDWLNTVGSISSIQNSPIPMNKVTLFRWCALIGYLGLLALMLSWFTWIAPPENIPRVVVIVLLVVPLLFPLRGMLHARRYTHQWVSFLSMFYFMVGVDASFNYAEGQAWLGYLTVVFSLMLFVGSIFYARYTPSTRSASGS